MPRSFDISQYAPNFSPLIDPLFNGGNINLPDMATIIADAIEAFFNDIVQAVDQYTGLDLSVFLPFVDNALTSLATLFGELDPASGTFDPVAAVITFLQLTADSGSQLPSALLTELIALWGGAASALPQEIIDEIVNVLTGGTGTNNPLSALTSPLQNLLGSNSPLNALNLIGQIPQDLFSLLPAGAVTNTQPNLLTNGLFDGPNSLNGQSIWSWVSSVFTTASTAAQPGSATVTADGVQKTLLSNVIPVSPGQNLGLSTQVLWNGLLGTGSPIQLVLQTFSDALGHNLAGTVLIASAGAADGVSPVDWSGVPTGALQASLDGIYVVPSSGVGSVSMGLQVTSDATGGQIWFGNAAQQLMGLMSNSLIQGVGGIPDLGATVQNTWDNFATTVADVLGLSGILSSDNSLSKVTMAVQGHAQISGAAQSLAQSNKDTLNIVNNKPVSAGLEATVESNMSLQSLGSGAAPSGITVTQSVSAGTWIRLGQAKTLGFVQWIGYATGTITGFYLNFAKMDTSGNWAPLFSSADLHTLLNSAWGWQLYDFSSGIADDPGDVIAVEFQLVGSGTYNIAGAAQSWLTAHPSADTQKTGFTRNTGAGGPTSLSVAAGSISWTGNAPYVGFGVGTADIPVPVQAPVTTEFTTNNWNTGATDTWTAPSWWRPGVDFIDVILLGGGGGGSSGTGGVGGNGSASTIAFDSTTLSAAGGLAGPSSGLTVSQQAADGLGPGTKTYPASGLPGSTTYYGGPEVTFNDRGGIPGGGGGGGSQFVGFTTYFGNGGLGGSWATGTYQPTTATVSVTVGAGGPRQTTYNAGNCADGAVWIVARQNA